MRITRHIASSFCALTLIVSTQAQAITPIVVELSAEASRPAANDLVRATVSAEASGTNPGELSKQINKQIAESLKIAKAYPAIKAQNAGTSTQAIYSKSGKIDSWRMRADLLLESGDTTAISELLGKLQQTLGVTNLVLQPAPETRKKAENDAMIEAIEAFKARAKIVAEALGKRYSIKQLTVNTNGRVSPPMYRTAAKSMMSEAVPMPLEGGESQISTSVSGQITLE